MTICPVALAVGCKKCWLFKACPAKSSLGNYDKDAAEAEKAATEAAGAEEDKTKEESKAPEDKGEAEAKTEEG